MSSAYHPQTDGQTEVVNRCLETYLRCFASTKPSQWPKWLSWAEYWFNTTYHSSAGMSPFRALYGRDPPALLKLVDEPSAVEEVNQLLDDRNAILDELKSNLLKAQGAMKATADGKRRDVQFQPGDQVYLKLQPYRMRSLARRPNEKLSPRFYGPFGVLERIGVVAYKLDLPSVARIHPVFHVSQLKPAVGTSFSPLPIPQFLTPDMELQVQPEAILQQRKLLNGSVEVLIKWKDLASFENTWEPWDLIHQQFPELHLEDKVALEGGSIVGDANKTKVYYRKKKKKKKMGSLIIAQANNGSAE